jgi:energy-coupling factor transporter ATP-binding protein EcfA2
MIESLEIAGFQCFETLALNGLARINVVTGSNASGKSALLEAVYLGANATAQAVQNIAVGRSLVQPTQGPIIGIGPIVLPSQSQLTLQSYFDHLFRRRQMKDTIETAPRINISYTDSDGVKYDLSIYYQAAGTDPTPMPIPIIRGIPSTPPIIFDRRKSPQPQPQSRLLPVTVNQFGQLQQLAAPPFGPATLIFGPDLTSGETDLVTWFSQLKVRNEVEPIIKFIQTEFPFVSDLEILAPTGANGIYASLGNKHYRLSTVSAGIYKIISILLACADTKNGIIIIDEIENGIYYEKYKAMWKIVYDFAKRTNNQIFVTSHSAECLEALVPVIDGNEKDFTLLRTERGDEQTIVRHISGTSLKAALRRQGEIRGVTIAGKTPSNP